MKKALRYKGVENTMKHIHRVEFQDPQNYDVVKATAIDEIKHHTEQGFHEFDEVDEVHVCRRPKKYAS
jgi:hypothetical protein